MVLSYVIQYLILTLVIYFGIYRFLSLDLSALAASFGIITVAIAFSSQQILQNFIAGIIISVQKPIKIDDWVDIGPGTGISKVKDIKMMRTEVRDIGGKLNSFSNSAILASRLINYSESGFVEHSLQITIPYNSDRKTIEKIILEVLKSNSRILPNVSKNEETQIRKLFRLSNIKSLFSKKFDPELFQPKVYTVSVGYPRITLEMRFWFREISKKDEIVSEILNNVTERLKKEKVEMV